MTQQTTERVDVVLADHPAAVSPRAQAQPFDQLVGQGALLEAVPGATPPN